MSSEATELLGREALPDNAGTVPRDLDGFTCNDQSGAVTTAMRLDVVERPLPGTTAEGDLA